MNYAWPGNVRELRFAIETAVVQTSGPIIRAQDLPPEIRPAGTVVQAAELPVTAGVGDLANFTTEELQLAQIKAALTRFEGNREQAAKALGMGERTLYRKIKEYGL